MYLQSSSRRLISSASKSINSKRFLIIAAAASALLGLGVKADAANATWTIAPSDGNWIPGGTNWSTGATTFPGAVTGLTNLDVATFNSASSSTTIAINNPALNFGSILFDTNAAGYTIGASGANGGNAALLSSTGSIAIASTYLGSGITQTINAPLVLEPASGTTAGTYTFTNNSSTSNGNILNFAGNISGGSTTFTATSDVGGSIQLIMNGLNSQANTISGLISDGGAGSGTVGKGVAIQKNGAGIWYLTNNSNSYTGETQITQGILNVSSISDYGVASAIGARGNIDTAAAGGVGILMNGGVLQYTGSTNQSSNRALRIGTGGGAIDSSGSGTLSFTRTAASPNLFQTAGTRSLILTGSNTGANTFSMTLVDQGGNATTLMKTGSGTWTYNGASSGNVNFGSIAGTLNITGTNTATGNTYASTGIVNDDFTGTNTGTVRLAAASKLVAAGGTFNMLGTNVAGQTSTQTFAQTTVGAGITSIVNTSGGAGLSSTLNLGNIIRTLPGGGLNFTLPSTGSTTVGTANAIFSGGQQTILGGYATVGGNTWAVSGSGATPGAISGLSTYNAGFLATKDVEAGGATSTPAAMTINSLRFNSAGAATVNTSGDLNIATGGILVTSGVGNNPISINNSNLTSGNGVDLIVNHNNPDSNSALTINSALTGTTGFTKLGAGSVILNAAANTYTGRTIVSGGTLTINGSVTSAPTVTGNSTFILGSTGSITAAGAKLAFDTNDISGTTPSVANVVGYLAGNITITGANDLLFAQAQSTGSRVTGTMYHTAGNIAVNQDTYVALNSPGNNNTFVTGTYNMSGGTLVANRQFFTGGWGQPVSAFTTSTLNISGGTLTAVNNGGNSFFNSAQSGVINLNTSGTLRTNAWNQAQTPAAGSTILNFNGGTLQTNVTSTDFLNSKTSAVKLYASGANIETAASTNATITQIISNTSNSAIIGASVSGGTSVFSTPQPLIFSGGSGSGASGYATINSSGLINGIVITNAGSYTAAPTISIAGYNGTVTQPTLTSNSLGGLNKLGTGTLTLSAANTYSGPTNINAGTLLLSGSLSTSSAVNVNNTGVLAGTPTSTVGAVTVASGGTISPGISTVNSGVGTFLAQSLTLSSGSNLQFEFGSGNDMITVGNTGGLTMNGGAFSLFAAGTINPFSTNGTYTLLNISGVPSGSVSNLTINPATTTAGKSYVFSNAGAAIQLTIADAPIIEWNGSVDGLWSNSGNWIGGVVPNGVGANVKFNNNLSGASVSSVILNGNKTVGGIVFDNSGTPYTIGGTDTLTFNNGAVASAISVTSGTHTISAPIALSSTLNISTTNAGDSLTLSSTISGTQPLIIGGSGTTILTGSSNATTTTAINGGILAIGGDATTIGAGGTSGSVGSSAVTIASGAKLVINRSNSVTLSNNISGAGTVAINGSGAVTLGGTNTFGALTTNAGSVSLSGSNSGMTVAMNGGTATVTGTGSLNTPSVAGATLQVGGLSGQNAVLNLSGGTISTATTSGQFAASLALANVSGAAGAMNMNSGTLTVGQQLGIGTSGSGSYGSFVQTAGISTIGSFVVVGANNDSSTMSVNGGTLSVNNNLITVAAGGSASNAVFNVGGGTVNSVATTGNGSTIGGVFVGEFGTATMNVTGGTTNLSGWGLRMGHTGTGYGTVNLNGGTVATPVASKGSGLGVVNFNGGTLKATANNATFMQGLTFAYVNSGGAVIDDNGNSITIGQQLLAPTGNGVSAAGLTVSGSGFIGQPLVVVSGGGGFGATAVANLDGGGNLVGISITNPGSDYTSDPTFTILGGGNGNTGSITGSATLVANVGGGLTKNGAGTTTLTASNLYSGATIVNNGRLIISGTGDINSSSSVTANTGGRFVANSSTAVSPVVTVAGGAVDGTGIVNDVVVSSNATSTVANGNGTTNAFTIGNLTFNGTGVLNLNTASVSPVLNVTNLSTNGSNSITVNATNASWTTGQVYDLVGYNTLIGTGFPAFIKGTITGLNPRQAATLTNPAGFVSLSITGDTPVWTGLNAGGFWTTNVLAPNKNWKLVTSGSPTDFITNDAVLFDDTATGITVADISTANVSPSSVTFNNSSKNYTINSSGGFGIATGSVTKTGTGTVTINTGNSYSGGTTISDGTIILGNSFALGSASGALTINGGILDTKGNNFTIGTLTGTGGTIKDSSASAGTTIVNVNQSVNSTFSGDIQDGATRKVGLTKTGTGTLTLSGSTANTNTGLTSITLGTLALQKSGVNAIGGDITIGDASGSDVLLVNAPDQIADSSSIFLNSGLSGNSAFLRLNDVNETIKGISTTTPTAAVIENASLTGQTAILTVNTAGSDYSYNGIIRNGNLGTTGILGLTKSGAGTLSLTNSANVVPNSFTGGTIVDGGILQINTGGGTGTLRGNVTVNAGATLLSTAADTFGFTNGANVDNLTINGGNVTHNSANNLTLQNVNISMTGGTLQSTDPAGRLDVSGGSTIFNIAQNPTSATIAGRLMLRETQFDTTFNVDDGTAVNDLLVSAAVLENLAATGITKVGSGKMLLSGSHSYTGSTTVAGGNLSTTLALQTGGGVNVSGGGTLEIPANGGSSGVTSVGIVSITDGTINLHDNDLISNYGANPTNYTDLVNQVKIGLTLLGGAGTSGIGSSEVDAQTIAGTILAVVDDGDPNIAGGITSLSGFTVPNPTTSVLIKYTWFGDANLDGVVDGSDYALTDTGFTSGGALTGWVFGDYDYNGTVDGGDYALQDTGFIAQTGALPEPTTLGLLGLGAVGMLRRRRSVVV